MTIEELATFVEAVNEGSMAGASRSLGIPTSTVSRRIRRLEATLGVVLLESNARVFRVTEAGDRLFKRSASAVRDLREAAHAIRDGSDATRGQLRISAPQDFGSSSLFGELVFCFREEHPGIEIMLDLTDRRVDLLAEGVDFAFRFHGGAVRAHAASMTTRLARMQGGLFASPDYLEVRGVPRTVTELVSESHVLVLPELGIPLELLSGDERYPLAGALAPIRATSMGFMLPAALQGLGIVPLPDLLAAEEVRRGHLVRVLPAWSMPPTSVSLVWPSSRLPAPRRRAFLDFVKRHAETRWTQVVPPS